MLRHFCASQLYLGGLDLVAIQEPLGHSWIATTMNYIHVHRTHIEDAWVAGQQRAAERLEGLMPMKWNLRLAAANRGIWKASELQRMLAERGLVISAGKMSGLWSGNPASIKLDDLDVICAVLGCAGRADLLIRRTGQGRRTPRAGPNRERGRPSTASAVTPRRRDGRSLPPPFPDGHGRRRRRHRPRRSPLPGLPGAGACCMRSYCRGCYDFVAATRPADAAIAAGTLAVKKRLLPALLAAGGPEAADSPR